MNAVDREQLKRDLSEALSVIQRDHDVVGLDALSTLGPMYAFHGRLILSALEPTPRHYSALIWNLVRCSTSSSAGWRRPG